MRMAKIVALAVAMTMFVASAAFAGPVYDKIMQTKKVRVGIMTDSIPGAFYNEKGEWVGFDYDIATEVAKRMGVEIDRVAVNNQTRISFLQQGRIDISVANMTHTRERDKSIDFSITYFFDGQKVLAKKGQFTSLNDMVGKKIATMQGTTSELNLKAALKAAGDPDYDKNVISYQKESQCFQALQSGRVAGWSTDATILLGYASKTPGAYELVGDFLSDEPYGMGLPQDDSALRDAVNMAIQDMWRDGTYMEIYNKWYGPGTPFEMPMSDQIELWP
ncbi:ABC-type transporter, periplasmic subunit family 3 [Oleidesulfovibrio alaskensis G20]|uniref:ABC-type transporter, periplasmic subunit family 3 n=1 Tax=Oleidesulfovibrio alaskensis (strain ATCC BAA-1058 / DSM 17464 / G20) TaxID=207559 RepID=Q30XN6_OLEA2|nr:transporter substrate-binding domain-containing protein [Oleidesulfovibrio alaskensis]ABB39560.1 ABC-type transporter, periplasmic subunit family 3 [Oleidesulfovibrio alaskensis G20]MBG0772380.1 transporter substrate-binding domain-containing protein [Oleidesulfovibrio alaskensis]